ncbi:MAG: hypothetical protein WA872_04515 [Candidatus Sulfotelmatobacter sp.]
MSTYCYVDTYFPHFYKLTDVNTATTGRLRIFGRQDSRTSRLGVPEPNPYPWRNRHTTSSGISLGIGIEAGS